MGRRSVGTLVGRSRGCLLGAGAGVAAALVLTSCAATSVSATHPAPAGGSNPAGGAATATSTPAIAAASGNADPAVFAPQVIAFSRQAAVDPRLLMAILYNESYKPHDPALERAWHQLEPDSAYGIANMHEQAFDDTKRGRSFAARRWDELPDDPALAVEAAAWYLHDLGAGLPAHWTGPYSRDDLLALGYDAGPGNMLAFARGVPLLPLAASYLSRLHDNWARAAAALGRA